MARPRTTASVRRLVADAVAKGYTEADITAIIDAAKGSVTSAAAVCPDCGHAMKISIPDFKKQTETLISLLEQAEGKTETARPEATTVVIERPPR